MAFCREGGKGAHVSYIDPSDNRGAGAWVSREVNGYKDGTRVKFVVKAEGKVPEEAVPLKGEQSEEADEETFEDKNCSDFKTQKEAKEYLLPGDPHRLDPDQDGSHVNIYRPVRNAAYWKLLGTSPLSDQKSFRSQYCFAGIRSGDEESIKERMFHLFR